MSAGNEPTKWGSFELCRSLDLARSNQFATFQNCQSGFRRLNEINDCFELMGNNMSNPNSLLPALLFARSHSSFIGACGAGMCGASAEAFALSRLAIEHAGYALLIHSRPALGEVWLNRSSDKKSVRGAFTNAAVRDALQKADQALAKIYSQIYEATIDFGAHPNEMALTGSMTVTSSANVRKYAVRYFDDRPLTICHAMKSSAEAGLCSLHVFQHVFPERFMLLGIRDKLKELRQDLAVVFKPPAQ